MAGQTKRINWLVVSGLGLAVLALLCGLLWLSSRDQIKPPPAAAISLDRTFAVLGDSYTEGAGAGSWDNGWVTRVSDDMCWTLVKVSAQGGTGYVSASRQTPGSADFPRRVQNVTAGRPEIVLVQGGLNDLAAASEKITSAAVATFNDIKAGIGGGQIIAVGPVVTPRTDPNEVARVSAALEEAARVTGVRYIDAAKAQWVHDPKFFVDDGYHLNPSGYEEYARRLIEELKLAGLQPSCR
ncbi:SGNH/GDSL hydrolase family protein [Mycobacterium sp. LTG2003]